MLLQFSNAAFFSTDADATINHHTPAASHQQRGREASASDIGAANIHPYTRTLKIDRNLKLSLGGSLPSLTINYFDSAWFDEDKDDGGKHGDAQRQSKPIVYIMPSMSHSAFVTRPERFKTKPKRMPNANRSRKSNSTSTSAKVNVTSTTEGQLHSGMAGWWEDVVGSGAQYGIDLRQFRVISASPLGAPYGTTSALSPDTRPNAEGRYYRARFPLITPLDQARVHAMLLDELGIDSVHAVVGASMGGMQCLQFAVHYPHRYDRLIAMCTTGQTSPSTQALRSVQRSAVRSDANYFEGEYADHAADGPVAGMSIARMVGTICYRSREEFDKRFDQKPIRIGLSSESLENECAATRSPPTCTSAVSSSSDTAAHSTSSSPSPSTPGSMLYSSSCTTAPQSCSIPLFEVERYLAYQASTFTSRSRYDANCYLTLSHCMDLMNLAYETVNAVDGTKERTSYDAACATIPKDKQFLLLPCASDALIPPHEMERLASVLGGQGKRVHIENIHSMYGHDAFLKEPSTLNPRFQEFLKPHTEDGVSQVRSYVQGLLMGS